MCSFLGGDTLCETGSLVEAVGAEEEGSTLMEAANKTHDRQWIEDTLFKKAVGKERMGGVSSL